MSKISQTRRDECRAALLAILKPGATVYTQLHHVSASGMTRRISLLAVADGEIRNIDRYAADLIGSRVSDKGGITTQGCGMDMGFDLVYSLGHYLWSEGTPEPHGTRNGTPDTAGGYALRHRWL
jgi:hypothetical protein